MSYFHLFSKSPCKICPTCFLRSVCSLSRAPHAKNPSVTRSMPLKGFWQPDCGGRAESILTRSPHLPSGKLRVCCGKSPFFIGKSTISRDHFLWQTVSLPEGNSCLVILATSVYVLSKRLYMFATQYHDLPCQCPSSYQCRKISLQIA